MDIFHGLQTQGPMHLEIGFLGFFGPRFPHSPYRLFRSRKEKKVKVNNNKIEVGSIGNKRKRHRSND